LTKSLLGLTSIGLRSDRRTPRIVEALDQIEHLGACSVSHPTRFERCPVGLQRREKALHRSVVPHAVILCSSTGPQHRERRVRQPWQRMADPRRCTHRSSRRSICDWERALRSCDRAHGAMAQAGRRRRISASHDVAHEPSAESHQTLDPAQPPVHSPTSRVTSAWRRVRSLREEAGTYLRTELFIGPGHADFSAILARHRTNPARHRTPA
jgi:hypothetical protein